MKIQNVALSAGLAALAVFALAARANTAAPPQPPVVVAQAETPKPDPKRFGEHMMIAPMYVTLEKGVTDAGGETEFIAHLQINDSIRYPVTIEITPPPRDGVLTAGVKLENLDLSQPGNIDRSFKVKSSSGIDLSNAVKVVVQGGSPILGFRAEKQWPPAPELKVPPRTGPQPPMGRPAGAVPFKPTLAGQLASRRQHARGGDSSLPLVSFCQR